MIQEGKINWPKLMTGNYQLAEECVQINYYVLALHDCIVKTQIR